MTDQILSPKILGYWTDEQRREIPDTSGIFLVLRAGIDPETKTVDVQELLYVGEHRSARYGVENDTARTRW
ncbi:hypothetical protein [Halomonas sp.]|uniref:hypothetical protein n=1 Tax=Halomonas sp. TaxID=1486246 RepID=UPI003569FB1B